MKYFFLIPLLTSLQLLYPSTPPSCDFIPQFSGTLLEFDNINEPQGSVSLFASLYGGGSFGIYDNNWGLTINNSYGIINPEVFGYIGLTKYIQFEFTMQAQTIFFNDRSTTHFGDVTAGLGFQFLWDQKNTPTPNLRLDINAIFPTGKYQNLDPLFNSNDANSNGAYGGTITFVLNKLFHNIPCHPYYLSLNLSYTQYGKTSIKGFNAYGGSLDTQGIIHPGSQILLNLATEYAFSKKYAFALDVQYSHVFAPTFRGTSGYNPTTAMGAIFLASQDMFSLTPAFEFTVNPNLAFYVGVSFSLIGRNTPSYAVGNASMSYTF